jgi:hypothetical protein
VVAGRAASVASASAHFEEPARPTRVEPAFSLANALDEIADEPIPAGDAPELAQLEPEKTVMRAPTEEPDAEVGGDERPATAADADGPLPIAADHDAEQLAENKAESDSEDRAATVSNLEQEMARLLGQITTKPDD